MKRIILESINYSAHEKPAVIIVKEFDDRRWKCRIVDLSQGCVNR